MLNKLLTKEDLEIFFKEEYEAYLTKVKAIDEIILSKRELLFDKVEYKLIDTVNYCYGQYGYDCKPKSYPKLKELDKYSHLDWSATARFSNSAVRYQKKKRALWYEYRDYLKQFEYLYNDICSDEKAYYNYFWGLYDGTIKTSKEEVILNE